MHAEIQFKLLNILQKNPSLSQRQIAAALNISLGKTNYCLNALKQKGWVKWCNFSHNPNKISYIHILTPAGIREKLSLTLHFLNRKQEEYEQLRKEIIQLQAEIAHNAICARSTSVGHETPSTKA
jgi:EPS-associated MarR family transcriptional regulator